MHGAWIVEERRGTAAALHAGWPAADERPNRAQVAVCRVTGPALVLGSTQPESVVDLARAAAAGVALCRRRSGGGAVLVTPADPVWIDIWLPGGHPLWRPDVGRAFDWLGDCWVDALTGAGLTGLSAHRTGFVSCTRWSSLVCFGGVGTGEVVTDDGRKLVGLAQRRNRQGSWFHGACVLRWDPGPLLGLLAMDDDERRSAGEGLGNAVVGTSDLSASAGRPAMDAPAIASAFIDALP